MLLGEDNLDGWGGGGGGRYGDTLNPPSHNESSLSVYPSVPPCAGAEEEGCGLGRVNPCFILVLQDSVHTQFSLLVLHLVLQDSVLQDSVHTQFSLLVLQLVLQDSVHTVVALYSTQCVIFCQSAVKKIISRLKVYLCVV